MFCRIYTTGNKDKSYLINELSLILGERISDGKYLESAYYSLDITKNDEYDQDKEKEFPDGFLYFRMSIEIDFSHNADNQYQVHIIDTILTFLWNNKIPAVASCDLEDMLIKKGGVDDPTLPWPI